MLVNRGKEIMKKQSVLPAIVLIIVLVISMLGFQIWNGQIAEAQGTRLKVVNPLTGGNLFEFTDAEKSVADTFVVNITVVDVTDLYGWQIYFMWDPSLLDFSSVELPQDNVFAGQTVISASDVGSGYVIYGVSLAPGMNSFNGTGTLCQITLIITQSVSPVVREVSCDLTFANLDVDTFFLDTQGWNIPFVAFNGIYDYRYVPTITYMKIVNPLTGDGWFNFTILQKTVGDTFIVNITVVNAFDLDVWQIKLTWNPSLLAFVHAEIPSDNVFAGKNPLAVGALETGALVYGAVVGPGQTPFSGNGTLCQITLSLTSTPSELAPEISCDLGFSNIDYDTFLCMRVGTEWNAYYPFVALEGSYNYKYYTIDAKWTPTCPWPYVNSTTPRMNEPVLVNLNVTVPDVEYAVLSFRRPSEEWYKVSMVFNATTALWTQTIPGQARNGTIEFFVEFWYGGGNSYATSTYTFKVKDLPAGDVNGDGVVNMKDIAFCVIFFNSKSQDP